MKKPTMIRRSRPRRESKKREAECLASRNPRRNSTIVPKSSSARKSAAKSASPQPRKAIPKKKRSAKETVRIYGTEAHIVWMKGLPCAFCGVVGWSEVAHVRNGGMSRKASWRLTVPACGPHPAFVSGDGIPFGALRRGCHVVLDANKKSWRAMYDTDARAAHYAAEWRQLSER